MKNKLFKKLCALSILGCTLLAATPVLATTYLQEEITGSGETNLVELGKGTRYFYGECDILSGKAYAYKEVDWSPDVKICHLYLSADTGEKSYRFTSQSGYNYYGKWKGNSSDSSAYLSFSN